MPSYILDTVQLGHLGSSATLLRGLAVPTFFFRVPPEPSRVQPTALSNEPASYP